MSKRNPTCPRCQVRQKYAGQSYCQPCWRAYQRRPKKTCGVTGVLSQLADAYRPARKEAV